MSLPDSSGHEAAGDNKRLRGPPFIVSSELTFETYIVPATVRRQPRSCNWVWALPPSTLPGKVGSVSFPLPRMAPPLDQSGNWQTWDALNAVGGWFLTRRFLRCWRDLRSRQQRYWNSHTAHYSPGRYPGSLPDSSINDNSGLGVVGFRSNSKFRGARPKRVLRIC